ncbi:MAG: hypothetical protein HC914_20900 [Chloroflexaceae bacterium]|nr:hypothetical protein [Chloroflexaceae bacterium]
MATHKAPRPLLRWLVGLALWGALLLALGWSTRPDGRLHVWVLDVEGDAVLVQTPGAQYVLIDGGADPPTLTLALGETLPFWQRKLAAVVLTHGDEERLPAQVAVLERYSADIVLLPAALPDEATSRELLRLLEVYQVPYHVAQPGDQLAIDALTLTIFDTGTSAERLALRLDYGGTRVQIGPATASSEAAPLTLLVYPWTQPLDAGQLAAWQPQAIVFTRAGTDTEGVPLTFSERAQISGVPAERLYHPGLHGTIELIGDGQQACIMTARCPDYGSSAGCAARNATCRAFFR